MYVPSILGVIPAMLLLVAASLVLGDEPEAENARAARALEHAKQEMSALKIRESVRGGEEFHLVGEPVLKWSNPIRGSLHGAVYIWTLKGRPVVVGSFLEWFVPEKSRWIELHSLSLGPVAGERPDGLSWTANRAGIELKPIPDAPAPAATPAGRLRQIRELAKDFTGRQQSHDGIKYEMRLLLQPLYRYEGTEGDLVDGALFAIVHATDPEVFLQIEARKVGGALQWQYALARFNSIPLAVSHKGREIWTAPQISPWTKVLDCVDPYATMLIGQRER
jgi:hypothetical protein